MELNATLLYQIVVFFILSAFTMKFVWPPLIKAIEDRREKIAEGLEAAERGKAQLDKANADIQKIESQSKAQVQERIADAEKRAAIMIEQAKKDAEVEKARIVAQAEAEAQNQILKAKEALKETLATLVVEGAEKILKREVNAANHADLLKELKDKL